MTDETIHDSDAITRTKTALVFDLADGRTVELTAHVQTPRDNGLRGMELRDSGSETQAVYQAGSASLILRDVDAEDDTPIGILPVDLDGLDIDIPDDWRLMDRDEVRRRIYSDVDMIGPVFEHESGEAWLRIERQYHLDSTYYHVYIEAGTLSLGIHPANDCWVNDDYQAELEATVQDILDDYDHDLPKTDGDGSE